MFFYLSIFFLFSITPILWLNYVLNKNDKTLKNMPFNGLEFGNIILKENGLSNVQIEKTSLMDHYDLEKKKIRVSEKRLLKKSITAISIVCHEIGHAIQQKENYYFLNRRNKLVKNFQWLVNLGTFNLIFVLPILLSLGLIPLLKLSILTIVVSIFTNIIIHLITIEVEIDASFNRAMPILKEKVPKEYHAACHSVLRAAALTYVIGVIRNFFSFRILWLILSRFK